VPARDQGEIVARFRLLALVLAVGLVVAGCPADPETDDAQPDEPTPEPVDDEPVHGGTLVVALSADPGHLNPAISTAGPVHTASELLYNGLLEFSDELEPLPSLAESWDIEDDGATYTFHLRDDVVWHDGTPFTSADVVYTFTEVLLEFHARTAASLGAANPSIEVPDDHTVVFRFEEPYAPLLQQLDVTEAPILAAHIYEGTDPNENPANTEPVGTGPFRFVSYAPDSEIVFERNDDYWKDDLPYFDRVVQRIIPDSGAQVIALEGGEVNFLWGVPGPDRERLEADENVAFITAPLGPGGGNCIMTVSFNLERPLWQDLRTRQAIAHALDRDQFLERILFGEGRVADAPISSGIPFAHAQGLDMPSFDRDEAERLLDEAGWVRNGDIREAQGVEGVEDGTPFAFTFLHFPAFNQYGELLRAQLREVGIDVGQRPLEPPVFAETVFTERDFDTNIISYCNGPDPEIGVRRMYDSANIRPVPFSNSSAYVNEDVDRLFDEAQRTVDTDRRGELYREIQEILVEELPYFWIVETTGTRAHRAECEGFKPFGLFAEEAFCRD
jgi:peptide/nickel transport system substrate-binding protein